MKYKKNEIILFSENCSNRVWHNLKGIIKKIDLSQVDSYYIEPIERPSESNKTWKGDWFSGRYIKKQHNRNRANS